MKLLSYLLLLTGISALTLHGMELPESSHTADIAAKDEYAYAHYVHYFPMSIVDTDHRAPAFMRAICDQNLYCLQNKIFSGELIGLPGYFIKYDSDISRVVGALLINECATRYGYNVRSPDKYTHITSSGKRIVICTAIKKSNKPFTCAQLKDVYKLFKKTLYSDIHSKNIINGTDGTVYVIDTENNSFSPLCIAQSPSHKKSFMIHMITGLQTLPLDMKAYEWICNKEIKKRQATVNHVQKLETPTQWCAYL